MSVIVLDPGHGGADPGAVGFGLQEKELNLDIALRARRTLAAYQCSVYLTRETDTESSLAARAELANSLDAGCLISFHINAGGGTGFESYRHTNADSASAALQQVVHTALMEYYAAANFPDRGQKTANFAVLRLSEVPAVLLENLFIDIGRDAASLSEAAFREGIAGAITAGLVRALDLEPVSTWDPVAEINELQAAGLINTPHAPEEALVWGEFAAVMNRYRGASSVNDVWGQVIEIEKLQAAGLVDTPHAPEETLVWSEFAAVLNRYRGVSSVNDVWQPEGEIEKLKTAGLIASEHAAAETVLWGDFATVMNRL